MRDGRTLAWHEWGARDGTPLLRLQGTPGSRLSRYPRLSLWERLGLRVIMADRPGYGASTRLPGRGLAVVADDLVELLDHLALARVPLMGGSGGGPHVLAMCARHPERVRAATVAVGAAPFEDDDVPLLVGLNAEAYGRIRDGGWDALYPLLAEHRDALLADPISAFRAAMAGAPESDREIMADPAWQRAFAQGASELCGRARKAGPTRRPRSSLPGTSIPRTWPSTSCRGTVDTTRTSPCRRRNGSWPAFPPWTCRYGTQPVTWRATTVRNSYSLA